MAVAGLTIAHHCYEVNIMTKERRRHRKEKKRPAMAPKEKKAAKKSGKESRDSPVSDRIR